MLLLAALSATPRIVPAQQDAGPPLPDGVKAALQQMVEAQRSGDLEKYAATLASPVGPVFRLHADSATKVGEAKRQLKDAMPKAFKEKNAGDPFAYAFDDTQLRATLQRLVSMQIDDAGPSGQNWKLNVTSTVRMPDGSTRTVPQGFIATEVGLAGWKVQDLAIAGKLAGLKKGAEANWAIYRAFNVIADDVKTGKYKSQDEALAAAKAAHDQIISADAVPMAGHDDYVAATKLFQAGEFAKSIELYKSASDKGYPHAACMVAIQYSNGEGIKQNNAAAVEWFRKDIARHDATAQNFLGSMMLEGEGVAKDPAEGLRLLKLSADQDNAAALLNIGRAYLFGLGVPKDPSTGMTYYLKSAELGNDQAAYFVKWMGQSPGNRMFKDDNQASAYQQIMLLRANALTAEQSGYRGDGTYRAADARLAAQLRTQADQLARDNGLD